MKRLAYRSETYWGRPVPGFGDPEAKILVIGLAPGAHGANRTGRMFTGDRSGEFLFRAMYEAGLANQPESVSREDGLRLRNVYITAAARCVPPNNKPNRDEIAACRPFLVTELELLVRVKLVVVLGGVGFDSYLSVLQSLGRIRSRASFRFAHGATFETHAEGPGVLASYHPSQQNTSTGRLTREMLREIFVRARRLIEEPVSGRAAGT